MTAKPSTIEIHVTECAKGAAEKIGKQVSDAIEKFGRDSEVIVGRELKARVHVNSKDPHTFVAIGSETVGRFHEADDPAIVKAPIKLRKPVTEEYVMNLHGEIPPMGELELVFVFDHADGYIDKWLPEFDFERAGHAWLTALYVDDQKVYGLHPLEEVRAWTGKNGVRLTLRRGNTVKLVLVSTRPVPVPIHSFKLTGRYRVEERPPFKAIELPDRGTRIYLDDNVITLADHYNADWVAARINAVLGDDHAVPAGGRKLSLTSQACEMFTPMGKFILDNEAVYREALRRAGKC